MNKTAIKNFAIWARRKLIKDVTNKCGILGITEDGIAEPQKAANGMQIIGAGTPIEQRLFGDEIAQRNALVSKINEKKCSSDYKTAFRSVVEEVAYTWFNRLIAVRFMEVNDYLPTRTRVLSSIKPGKVEPDLITSPFDADLKYTAYERDRIMQLKDGNKADELFRMLF
ncbi:MAG TPA: hypothetical protein PLT66_08270 [Bacillota bacterium]|nr:hypothetical protein [Bacillota bacterium]